MNSQARPSHNIFQWVSPHFLFWTFNFLNIWYWMTGAEYHSIKSTPLCLFYTLFYFNITISLFWVRNINVSNCLPELSLLFHVYVRYYSPNFNKLLSFSFLKRVVVEKSSFEMTDLGLSSSHLFDSVILAKLLTWLLSLNVLICKVRIVIVPFWWSLLRIKWDEMCKLNPESSDGDMVINE